jgi:hypothetical protein
MQIRRWALNAGIAGLALVIAGIAVATGGQPASFGWFSYDVPLPAVVLSTQALWGVVLLALGLLTLLWTIAWTVGNNASRPADAADAG